MVTMIFSILCKNSSVKSATKKRGFQSFGDVLQSLRRSCCHWSSDENWDSKHRFCFFLLTANPHDHPSPPPWRSVPFLITPLLLPEAQMSLHHRPWQSLRAVQENLANIPFSGVSFSFSLLPPYLIKLLGSAEMKHRCSGIAEMIPDLGLEREGAPCEFQ